MKCVSILFILMVISVEPLMAQQDEAFERWKSRNDQDFQTFIAQEDSSYKRYIAEIKAIWNTYEPSTRKIWVDYSPDLDTKSKIEFEDGYIELETVQKSDVPDAIGQAKTDMKKQLKKLVGTDNEAGLNILEDQIAVEGDEQDTVNPENLETFFDKTVQKQIKPIDQMQSGDGHTRIRYRVKVPFVKNHIVRRSEKYVSIVVKYAAQYQLDPKLVLAMIYVESAFNPMAKSHANAYGMMQLVPRYGGRDAYAFVYNQDRAPSPAELYQPEKNIQLGCAYLHLLLYKHWTDEPAEEKRRDLAICSYNWGPHNVKEKVYDRFQGRWLSYEDMYQRLRQHTPRETSDYLKRVLSRRTYFDPFFEG